MRDRRHVADHADGQTRRLQSADRGSLATNSNRWYRYDVKNKDGEALNITVQWNYSDGNTYHQAGFGVYDRYQFDSERAALVGLNSGRVLGPGVEMDVRVDAVDIDRGAIVLGIPEGADDQPRPARRERTKPSEDEPGSGLGTGAGKRWVKRRTTKR